MILCTFLMALRASLASRGDVLLVDGPMDGKRISGFIIRGRLKCEGGEYLYVLGADPLCLYWVPYPYVSWEQERREPNLQTLRVSAGVQE
ncbi:MAG: hypothetical protein ACYC3I_02690 [Gemmataceae bacterium]